MGLNAGGDVYINPPSSNMEPLDERDFVSITPDQLVGFFRADQTTIQSNRTVEPYIGKWMKFEGDLGDVLSFRSDSAMVTFAPSIFTDKANSQKTFIMGFSGKEWVERLYVLPKGSHIVVEGQINRVSSTGIHLDHCKLVQ